MEDESPLWLTTDAVAARALGLVQRVLGPADQLYWGHPGLTRTVRDAERYGHVDRRAAVGELLVHHLTSGALCHLQHLVQRGAGEHEGELVAAVAGEQFVLRNEPPEPG